MPKWVKFALVAGFVAAASAVYYIYRKKKNPENPISNELSEDSMQEAIEEDLKNAEAAIEEAKEILDSYGLSQKEASDINRDKADIHEYARPYFDYSAISKQGKANEPEPIDISNEEDTKEPDEIGAIDTFFEPEEPDIHTVTINDFGENYAYRQLDLTYYKDGVMADVRDRRVSDVDMHSMLGDELLASLDTTEMDVLLVVNNKRQEYYEIFINRDEGWSDIYPDD